MKITTKIKATKVVENNLTDADIDYELVTNWNVPGHEVVEVREILKKKSVYRYSKIVGAMFGHWWLKPSSWPYIGASRCLAHIIRTLKVRPARTQAATPVKVELTFSILSNKRNSEIRNTLIKALSDPEHPITVALQTAIGPDTDVLGALVTVGDSRYTRRLYADGGEHVTAVLGSQASLATGL
jgi:hypothetical protein